MGGGPELVVYWLGHPVSGDEFLRISCANEITGLRLTLIFINFRL